MFLLLDICSRISDPSCSPSPSSIYMILHVYIYCLSTRKKTGDAKWFKVPASDLVIGDLCLPDGGGWSGCRHWTKTVVYMSHDTKNTRKSSLTGLQPICIIHPYHPWYIYIYNYLYIYICCIFPQKIFNPEIPTTSFLQSHSVVSASASSIHGSMTSLSSAISCPQSHYVASGSCRW